MWRIEFNSEHFLPILPEECQGNSGVYGFEFAWWLAQALAAKGVATSYPRGEDWGWYIEYINSQDVEFTIGCASVADDGAGYTGHAITWSVFIRPQTSLKQRLAGKSTDHDVVQLAQHILTALQEHGISQVQSAA